MRIFNTNSTGTYIEVSSPELMWLGNSGQPYRGTLYIQYINNGSVTNLLDIKKYIGTLRGEVVLLEDIAFKIYNSIGIDNAIVTVKTTARGGISSTIKYPVGNSMDVFPEQKPIVFGIQ